MPTRSGDLRNATTISHGKTIVKSPLGTRNATFATRYARSSLAIVDVVMQLSIAQSSWPGGVARRADAYDTTPGDRTSRSMKMHVRDPSSSAIDGVDSTHLQRMSSRSVGRCDGKVLLE